MTVSGILLLALSSVGGSADLAEELRATEVAFAGAAEARDVDRFSSFLAADAVFSGSGRELRGPEAIVEAWSVFFADNGPSITWRPETVSVLDDGSLGMTSGPYRVVTRSPAGEESILTGTFFSVWRRTDAGWRIILDGGTTAEPEPTE